MPSPVPEDVKNAVQKAYAEFLLKLRDIAHTHRTTVTEVLTEVENEKIAQYEEMIKNAPTG